GVSSTLSPFLTVLSRYVVVFPFLAILQGFRGTLFAHLNQWIRGQDLHFMWMQTVKSGPMNACGLFYLIACPILLCLGIYHHIRVHRHSTKPGVEAVVLSPSAKQIAAYVPLEENNAVQYMTGDASCKTSLDCGKAEREAESLNRVAMILSVIGMLICLPTKSVQSYICDRLGVPDIDSINNLADSLGSAIRLTGWELLGGDNSGMFPFLTSALIGLAWGLRLRATSTMSSILSMVDASQQLELADDVPVDTSVPPSKVSLSLPLSAARVEWRWGLLYTGWGLVVWICQMVVYGVKEQIQSDIEAEGAGATILQTGIQILGLTFIYKTMDNVKDLSKLVRWSMHLRVWSTYSCTVYVLNYVIPFPLRVLTSKISDQCSFIERESCHVYPLILLQTGLSAVCWHLALLLWDRVGGVLSLDWCLSTIGRGVFAIAGSKKFVWPNMSRNHRDIEPVCPWRDTEYVDTDGQERV
ncbi:hypothetical protein KIPB_002005, partial [Kipferlia bialata]